MLRWIGLLRSLAVYYAPWSRRAWLRFSRSILRPGDLVFDVGAHVGTRARAMRRAGARVIAIEPQPFLAGFLRRTLPRDIPVVEAAVGRAAGEGALAVSRRHPSVSSLQPEFVTQAKQSPGFERVRWDDTEQVAVVTLDSLIASYGYPDYIKIDVEGFESEVLRGLSHPVALLSVEFLPGFSHLTAAVMDQLTQWGEYRFNPVVGEKARFAWSEWRDARHTRQWLEGLPAGSQSGDLFARLSLREERPSE